MVKPIPLMVELCAGTAALSLRLEKAGARPPVSRMGSKAGYSSAILSRLGLQPGQGARRYLWCDPDPGVRLLLHAYADRALALAAADIIRGWADEEPRALWERLRAEGPVKGPQPREVARELLACKWSFSSSKRWNGYGGPGCEVRTNKASWTTEDRDKAIGCNRSADRLSALPDTPAAILPTADIDPREVARWLRIVSSNRLVPLGPAWENTGRGGATFGGAGFCDPAEKVADGTAAAPQMPAAVVSGEVDPREVARWAYLGSCSYAPQGSERGYVGFVHPEEGGRYGAGRAATARRFSGVPPLTGGPLPACDGVRLPEGTVAYMDPPYWQTTGYADDIPRPEGDPYGWVRDTALRWAAAGATVVVSEAVPIPGLADLPGWHAHEITDERVGQKRTFSRQKREWLTMNRPPAGPMELGFTYALRGEEDGCE